MEHLTVYQKSIISKSLYFIMYTTIVFLIPIVTGEFNSVSVVLLSSAAAVKAAAVYANC